MTPRRIGAVQAHEGASAVPLLLWRDRSSRRQMTSREVPLAVSMRARMSACSSSRNHPRGTRRCWNRDQQTPYQDPGHACLLRRWHGRGGAVCGGGVVTRRAVPLAPRSVVRRSGSVRRPRCASTSRPTRRSHPYDRRAASRATRSHTRAATAIGAHYAPSYHPHCRYPPCVTRRDGHRPHRATASTYTAPLRGLRRNGSGRHPP